MVRLLASESLTTKGFRVIEADNAEEGLAILEAERPDLVMLDVVMPGNGRLHGLFASAA